jgi:membrane-associated phospholipid phosphatase
LQNVFKQVSIVIVVIQELSAKILRKISFFGNYQFFFSILGYLYFTHNLLFIDQLFALLIIILVGFPFRIIYFRERPKKQKHNNLLQKIDAGSFPSGHAARITALFILFSRGQSSEVIIYLWGLFLLVLYSRIKLRKHRYIDLLGGIVLGTIATL